MSQIILFSIYEYQLATSLFTHYMSVYIIYHREAGNADRLGGSDISKKKENTYVG